MSCPWLTRIAVDHPYQIHRARPIVEFDKYVGVECARIAAPAVNLADAHTGSGTGVGEIGSGRRRAQLSLSMAGLVW